MAKWKEIPVQDQLALFKTTQCAHCGDLIHQEEALVKTYHTGTTTEQEHFCGTGCYHSWYSNRLNQMGL